MQPVIHKTAIKPKHFITGEELSKLEMTFLLTQALDLKKKRGQQQDLTACQLALLFDKPSLRTRFSFTVAIRELGGDVVESIESTRKKERPADQAQVISGYCHAMVVRTHEDEVFTQMRKVATIPVINGLSELHHPCQILADLLTLLECFGSLEGLTLSYIGDGNNILHSLLLMAPLMGVNIHYCCPKGRGPHSGILARSLKKFPQQIKAFATPQLAAQGADAIYTDVWVSMGFECDKADHLFEGFQVHESLMKEANANAIFMHCLPMERGKEVSHTLPDQPCSVIFKQSENRLHAQKALLLFLLRGHLS